MSLPMAAPIKSPLSRYRLLAPSAAVRVSPICLGAMNFGNAWSSFMGTCDQENSEKILDFFYGQGGNFIDTANNYQCQESEQWVGKWMKKRGNRDQMVIATKYTTNFTAGGPNEPHIMANHVGNSTKSLTSSIASSLRNLQTDYIDVLYVHWWDYSTDIPELMQSLNHLVASGKVLYLGISNSPAWVVSKANGYARSHGLRQFSIYQGRWSAASRDFERDIIPMCRDEGMALAPWGALGSGNFKSEEQRKETDGRKGLKDGLDRRSQQAMDEIKVSKVLEKIAIRKNTAITSVALAYVMYKEPYVFPVIGGRKIEQLKDNIEALFLELTNEEIKEIEDATDFEPGFPHNVMLAPGDRVGSQRATMQAQSGMFDYVPNRKPITPSKRVE